MSNFRLSHILQSKSHKLFSKAVHPFRAFSNLKQLTLGALGNSRMQPQPNVSSYLQAGHANVLKLRKPAIPKIIQLHNIFTDCKPNNIDTFLVV